MMCSTPTPRRKKWSEAEEKTLILKYGDMVCDGSLAKMKTREKKFRPIACYVNSVHHARDPIAFPWLWTWKDVSTKVQNMRHQYLLVKQKIKKPDSESDNEFDWLEGLTHWSNFLRYKEVFGDVPIVNANGTTSASNDLLTEAETGVGNGSGVGFVERGISDMVEMNNGSNCKRKKKANKKKKKKKRKVLMGLEKKAWGFLGNQLGHLRELEARFEQREAERQRERERRESVRVEIENEWERKWEEREKEREEREMAREKLRKQMVQEWEAMENDIEERDRRREEELIHEKEWQERMNRRRSDWKKRIDEMLSQHRAEMGQIQTRILHEQQNLTGQLLGIVSQWTAHPAGLSDHTSTNNHYLSQMMQNLHHVNDMVHEDTRVEGDNQDDQFIVDG